MAIIKIGTPELFDFSATNTALQLPAGDTASRPTSPSTGEWRYNTDDNRVEYYDGAAWFQIDYEAVAPTCTTDTINYPSGTTNTAYYKMSDATDSTLNAYNGTATDVDFNVQGKFGNAGEFNGSSSNIEFSAGSFNNTTISVSAWINSASSAADQSIFNDFDYDGSTSKGFIWRKSANNTLNAQFYDNSGTQRNLNTTETITNNVWTNVVLTISSTEANIYINNGTPVTLTQNNLINFHSTTRAGIGSYRFTGGSFQQFFDGSIDQVRIFPTALTADNVTSLYNEVQCVPAIIPSDYFNPLLYTGNGSTQSIDDLTFQPDLVWIKVRDESNNHVLTDSVRGVDSIVSADGTYAESTFSSAWRAQYGQIQTFDTNGFTIKNSTDADVFNKLNDLYVAWNWKAAGFANDFNVLEGGTVTTSSSAATAGITAGTITTGWNVSANRDAGFSIVSYTGTGSNASVGHGLDSAPELILIKLRSGTMNWVVYNSESGASKFLTLNSTVYAETYNMWQNTSPTNSVFTISTDAQPNTINGNYIAYAFRSIPGFSDIGSYIGLGSSANPVIVTGFRPAFVMIKNTTSNSTSWVMADDRRGYNDLYANDSSAEFASGSLYGAHFLSNGFTTNTFDISRNKSGDTYIYLAIAEQVYNANGVTANQTNPFNDGSQVAQYEFEDNADDSQPNGYIGKGGTFNGTSSYISLGTSNPLNTFGGEQTISIWIKPNTSTHQEIIGYRNDSSLQWNYLEKMSNNTIRFLLRKSNTPLLVFNTVGTVTLNQWNHIVVTVNSTIAKIYINSGTAETAANTITSFSNSEETKIGDNDTGQGVNYFNGSIDQVRIYNTVLNPNDVWLLYSETSATSSTLDYPASTGAQALYELEGDATSTSSAAYNGTATDVAWVPLYDGTPTSITYAAPSVSASFLKAGVFNGSNSKIAIGSIFGSTFGTQNTQNFSFSGWFKINTAYSSSLPYRTIIGGDIANTSGHGGSYMIILYGTSTANEYYFNTNRYYGTTATYGANSPNQILLVDTWYHYAETYTASATSGQSRSVKYLNGSEISNSVVEGSAANATTNSNLALGQYRNGLAVWDGEIDQVRIFNKAIDAGQVLQLYNEPNN